MKKSAVLFLVLITFSSLCFQQDVSQKVEDILILFNSHGFLYTVVDKEFEVPDGWNVLHVSSDKWYLEKKNVYPEYLLPTQMPEGKYKITANIAVSDNGEKFVQTPFGLAKIIQEGRTSTILKSAQKTDALFQVPGGYRIYYTLKETTLEQFFEIRSPIDKAYVILSTSPEENMARVSYAKMSIQASLSDEVVSDGRKIFILGYLEGLTTGLNVRNKVLNITRKDWNKIELNYNYTYPWQPADYVIEIKTTDELPSGQVFIYSKILGKDVPIGSTIMPDLNKEGEIYVSKSWQIYHSWTLNKMVKSSGRVQIIGELSLKGNGLAKVIIRGKNLSGLNVSSGSVIKSASDYVEIQIPVSGVVKVTLGFNYVE